MNLTCPIILSRTKANTIEIITKGVINNDYDIPADFKTDCAWFSPKPVSFIIEASKIAKGRAILTWLAEE